MMAISLRILIFLFISQFFLTIPINTVSAEALLAAGMKAPEFSLKDINDREVNLSRYSDRKAIILVFWATWSMNSPKALKRFNDVYRKYAERGIEIIGINVESQRISQSDTVNIKRMIEDIGISFPVLIDRGLKVFHEYGVIAVPSTVIITDGKIDYTLPGYPLVGSEEMFDYIAALAGEKRIGTPTTVITYRPAYKAIAQLNLGREFVKKGMAQMAYGIFQKAITIDPKFILPYIELSRLYMDDGRFSEAEETLKKAIANAPDDVMVMTEIGALFTRAGRYKEAIRTLKGAIERNPDYSPALYHLGYAYGKEGMLKEALLWFNKAKELNPLEYMIYYLNAEIYENKGMKKEAAQNYRKAVEVLIR